MRPSNKCRIGADKPSYAARLLDQRVSPPTLGSCFAARMPARQIAAKKVMAFLVPMRSMTIPPMSSVTTAAML